MEVVFTLYRGFLIAEYSGTDVRAYRSREFYAGNTTSYEASSQLLISQVIDESEDYGGFTDAAHYALMQELGRIKPSQSVGSVKKYGVRIYWKSSHTMSEFLEEAETYSKAVAQVLGRVDENDVLQLDITDAPGDW